MLLIRCSAVLVMVLAVLAEGNDDRCLNIHPAPTPKTIYFSETTIPLTIQYTKDIGHRLISEVFAILVKEVLGYQNVKFINSETTFLEPSTETTLVPNILVYTDVIHDFKYDVNYFNNIEHLKLKDAGSISPVGRYGIFIPEKLWSRTPDAYHVYYFRSPQNAGAFDIDHTDGLLKTLSVDNATNRHFCSEGHCRDGVFTPVWCLHESCATLLTSHYGQTNFIMVLINELKLYMKVIWLGDNLREAVQKYTTSFGREAPDRSLIMLEYKPGYFTSGYENLTAVNMPNCDQLAWAQKTGCNYEMSRHVKLIWSNLYRSTNKVIYELLHNMYFDEKKYSNLLNSYSPGGSLRETACHWLRKNQDIWQKWNPGLEKKIIYIAGLFPLHGSNSQVNEITQAAELAMRAINNDDSILSDYELVVNYHDAGCHTDIVLKAIITYMSNEMFYRTIGFLGPACSESLEPVVSLSKLYKTVVISYSAEGSNFSDKNRYGMFFRTIGENGHYKRVYLELFRALGWKRIAAMAEDGKKFTEYLSSLGDMFQEYNMEFITNMKFPMDSTEAALTMHLKELKQKRARIIIADVYDFMARSIMCQAYKLKMTAKEGYVWFLPAWLREDWYKTDSYNAYYNEKIDCTVEQMEDVLDGYFSLNHAPFAPDDSLMQENITVGEWRKNYERHVEHQIKISHGFSENKNTSSIMYGVDYNRNFAGYAYDAVWTYAYALDRFLAENQGVLPRLHDLNTTSKFAEIIENTDFRGVSGRIKFYGGASRFCTINIIQHVRNKSVIVGSYYPDMNNSKPDTAGTLMLDESSISWLNPTGRIPGDGYLPPETCTLESVASFFNITCTDSLILVNILGFLVFMVLITAIIVYLKRKYDKKIKFNEDIMKAIGFDTNGGMGLTDLDKWETARECVVLNRKLGAGAFGTVYGGEALLSDGRGWVAVAVKTLKTGSSREEKVDFLSEAESMKRFDHKNIVKLLGVCTKSEPLYTIMEFMLYGDLKTYLLARRHLVNSEYTEEREEISSKKLTSMALDVARALSYLAQLKYVHRDVACRNCLVNAQRVVKLGDFGMTRLIFEDDYYRFTRKGMLPVRWMAPESIGLGIFTPASDVWSYAVLLYEIVTFGSFPFQGMTNNEALEHIKQGNTLKIPSGVKPQLEGLMKSCWNIDYKTRPHASEIAEFLSNSPRLISPCLDMPVASVEIDLAQECNPPPNALSGHSISDEVGREMPLITMLNSQHFDNPSYITTLDSNSNQSVNGCVKHKSHRNRNGLIQVREEEEIPFM